ncbi:uncharacterized protein LOC111696460 [Eurytemora carolleeae]|uniref:uncharacterized protein LOC111696460 n=1 Tax=Eurytemora carolleeae TaxID=1294199 RepID=UPI000C788AD2|nr:uncharacterized protein LOC111696460 [Eurytemora carolleeae]|eukprot:XP_023321833.1 uncharacterized protein LOC111696460 [Eurytemora affinis]
MNPGPVLVVMISKALIVQTKKFLVETEDEESDTADVPMNDGLGPCLFSSECQDAADKTGITVSDGSYVCIHGKCEIRGGFLKGGVRCDAFEDCSCRETPEACYCIYGQCSTLRYECHTDAECKKMKKCTGNTCKCSQSGLCELAAAAIL